MAREFSRTRRIEEQIQKELAEIIHNELKDPRVGWVTISGVEVSRDLAHANIFYTVLGQDKEPPETIKGLQKASGFMRHELGKRVHMRSIPQLHFKFDLSYIQGQHMSSLIDKAVAADTKDDETSE
ncbi:MAG: 30S ribosome-binding factor RbfA [Gammaproteobacteria bacterium]|nr:30S ribosome-binding factor RbfA [Gammaproteobacteria bacterium]